MKVSDYIARRLSQEGITHAFLVQGAASNDLIYSIADTQGIDYVCAMHEQAAGFMAEGWAKVTGKPGLAIATSGPGGQNLVTPIANCFYDSVPAIFITGQVNSRFMRKSDALRQLGFQEWPAVECLHPITKRAVLVQRPNDIVEELERALHECQSGRPGPVLLDLPMDVQRGEIDTRISVPRYFDVRSTYVPPSPWEIRAQEQLGKLVEDLKRAERPVLLIGGGVRGERAQYALDVLADLLRIPVFPTWNALDVVTSDHPWYAGRIGTYGGPGRNLALQNADLLIAVGCRISGRITGGRPETFARGAKKYVVDIDLGLLDPHNQEVRADESVGCDATSFLQELERRWRNELSDDAAGTAAAQVKWEKWRDWASPLRFVHDPLLEHPNLDSLYHEGVHQYVFARMLSTLAPANAIIVYDCGGNAVVMNHAFQTKRGQRYFSNNGNSPMGFALAAAIGAWFAAPERPVICVIGDGGFQLNIQELQTLVHYGAKVKVFVLNNHCYGITKAFQDTHFAGRHEASGPKGYSVPDFRKVIEAYGMKVLEIHEDDKIEQMVRDTLWWKVPVACLVNSPDFHDYYPKIDGWATPIEDMSPRLPREEFAAKMIGTPPLPGWETGEYR